MYSVVQENVGHSVTGRMECSNSDIFAQTKVKQLLKDAATSLGMRRIVSVCPFRRLTYINEGSSLSISAKEKAERDSTATAKRNELFLRLNKYEMSKETLKCKLSDQ